MGRAFRRLGAKAILRKTEQLEQVDTTRIKGQPRHQVDNKCTNAPVTKNITWYLSSYTSKKQSRSKNTSAVLANRLAFHNLQEQTDCDSINRNKRLLTRCVNSISRDQEFSAPEVISYLMGWGDRYISHHFVHIYWDSAAAALKKTFPGLKRKTLGIMSSVRYTFFSPFCI